MQYDTILVCRDLKQLRHLNHQVEQSRVFAGNVCCVAATSVSSMAGVRAPMVIVAEGVDQSAVLHGEPVWRLIEHMKAPFEDGAILEL